MALGSLVLLVFLYTYSLSWLTELAIIVGVGLILHLLGELQGLHDLLPDAIKLIKGVADLLFPPYYGLASYESRPWVVWLVDGWKYMISCLRVD